MVRKLGLLVGMTLLISFAAHAQVLSDKVEISGGYSYMRFGSTPGANLNGFDLNGEYKVKNWLGAVADFDGGYGSVAGVGSSVHTFLIGPQVSWHSRVSPFAHILFGGAHYNSGSFTSNSFSWALGAGIDSELSHSFSWRVIELDYMPTHFAGGTQGNARVLTGLVFRF